MRRMYRYGFLDETQNKLDYVLALTPHDVLERRLQVRAGGRALGLHAIVLAGGPAGARGRGPVCRQGVGCAFRAGVAAGSVHCQRWREWGVGEACGIRKYLGGVMGGWRHGAAGHAKRKRPGGWGHQLGILRGPAAVEQQHWHPGAGNQLCSCSLAAEGRVHSLPGQPPQLPAQLVAPCSHSTGSRTGPATSGRAASISSGPAEQRGGAARATAGREAALPALELRRPGRQSAGHLYGPAGGGPERVL